MHRHDLTGERAPRIASGFHVTGAELLVSEFSSVVGHPPTALRERPVQRGTVWPSGEPHVLNPGWSLELFSDASWSIDEELQRLLQLLEPRAAQIRAYLSGRPTLSTAFTTNVTIHEGRPEYGLSAPTLLRLVAFSCPWFLDIFDHSDNHLTVGDGSPNPSLQRTPPG